jgi:hypothetical protein
LVLYSIKYVIERASKHKGYLMCTRGHSPQVLIRLPSVLMFFFFCIIVQHKNTFPVVTIWNPGKKKPMNEHLNMIFLSLSLSLPSQYVNPAKMNQSMGMLWSNTCTPVNALCMYMYTIYLWERSQTMIQIYLQSSSIKVIHILSRTILSF